MRSLSLQLLQESAIAPFLSNAIALSCDDHVVMIEIGGIID
ncbi:hypothetical protein [Planktothrix mougeotii]|nr:hypothetical protein [Planktothrix mougeotii]